MRILFISRAFPPIIGGIERQNFEISKALSAHAQVHKVVNIWGKKFLVPFMFIALIKAFRLRKNYDVIVLGDGVLAIVAFIIRRFSTAPIVCIVHGLDITYKKYIYKRLWLQHFFKSIDHFIAVGNETIRQATKRGLDTQNFTFIPNGVDTAKACREHSKAELEKLLGFQPNGPLLLTLGRLVRRKGAGWFVEEVMPALDPSIGYIIAGVGRDASRIREVARRSDVADRIYMLGSVTEDEKDLLLSSVDIFIQPNIKVADDMEGFGLVILEAALHGRPVVASRLEGLADAVTAGKNGILLESEDSEAYIQTLQKLLENPAELKAMGRAAREFVIANYSWDKIAGRYMQLVEKLVRPV
jgi:glycosyltransferase involved in cell wall biosynthesis